MACVNPVVRVNEGELRGRQYKTLNGMDFYGFLDVPYATPPIGDLRFKPPLPPSSWEGVYDATKESSLCAQLDLTKIKENIVGNEDCLYLNVFTPFLESNDKPLPVMVFIHGGGFVFGSKEIERHGPHYLIDEGVIVVVINYRLGIFGFLNLDLPDAQGNMGLKDQVQALKWIQKNISSFNGDPSNVTIFGISAGGASVQLLCLSRMADGLFHKAIAHSGSCLNHWAIGKQMQELAFAVAKIEGEEFADTSQLLKYLKGVPAEKLAKMAYSVIPSGGGKGGLTFGFVPSIEKTFPKQQAFLSENTLALLNRGEFIKVPFVTGFCKREGLLLYSHNRKCIDKLISDKDFMYFLPFSLDNEKMETVKRNIESVYLDTFTPEDEEDKFVIDYFTDVDFLGGIFTATKLMAHSNSPIYFYEFTHDGDLNFLKKVVGIEESGACHGDETGYIFHLGLTFPTNECKDVDKLLRNRMVKMWTNFAKFGNPTPQTSNLLPTIWKPLTKDSFDYLIIDDQLIMAKDPVPERMSIYEDLFLNTTMNEEL